MVWEQGPRRPTHYHTAWVVTCAWTLGLAGKLGSAAHDAVAASALLALNSPFSIQHPPDTAAFLFLGSARASPLTKLPSGCLSLRSSPPSPPSPQPLLQAQVWPAYLVLMLNFQCVKLTAPPTSAPNRTVGRHHPIQGSDWQSMALNFITPQNHLFVPISPLMSN